MKAKEAVDATTNDTPAGMESAEVAHHTILLEAGEAAVVPDLSWFDDMAASTSDADLAAALWTEKQLLAFLPWGRSSIYELVKTATFPAAFALPGPNGPRLVWLRRDILIWVVTSERVPGPHRATGTADASAGEGAGSSEPSEGRDQGGAVDVDGWLVVPTRRQS